MKVKWLILIAVLIVIVDQVSKVLFKDKHFWLINYKTNTGAAFSILSGNNLLLSIIAIIALIVIFYLIKKFKRYRLPLVFIFAGTLGNLIDRLLFGFVRDFIDLRVWPVFNIADSFNVIGVILIVIYLITTKKELK